MTDNVEEFLEHFGVKGMHWGSRKSVSTPRLSDSHYAAKDKNRDYGSGGKTKTRSVAEGIDKGLSLKDARKRYADIEKKHGELSGVKSVSNFATGGIAAGAAAHLTLSAARAVVYSPATEKILSSMFSGSPYGTQKLVVNGLIGARKISDTLNSRQVKQGVVLLAAYEGGKKGYDLSEKHYRKKATKIVDNS